MNNCFITNLSIPRDFGFEMFDDGKTLQLHIILRHIISKYAQFKRNCDLQLNEYKLRINKCDDVLSQAS